MTTPLLRISKLLVLSALLLNDVSAGTRSYIRGTRHLQDAAAIPAQPSVPEIPGEQAQLVALGATPQTGASVPASGAIPALPTDPNAIVEQEIATEIPVVPTPVEASSILSPLQPEQPFQPELAPPTQQTSQLLGGTSTSPVTTTANVASTATVPAAVAVKNNSTTLHKGQTTTVLTYSSIPRAECTPELLIEGVDCIYNTTMLPMNNSAPTIAPTIRLTAAPTLKPTTFSPTTMSPTTSSPTLLPETLSPTTLLPVTLSPTLLPVTLSPTTLLPVTWPPTAAPVPETQSPVVMQTPWPEPVAVTNGPTVSATQAPMDETIVEENVATVQPAVAADPSMLIDTAKPELVYVPLDSPMPAPAPGIVYVPVLAPPAEVVATQDQPVMEPAPAPVTEEEWEDTYVADAESPPATEVVYVEVPAPAPEVVYVPVPAPVSEPVQLEAVSSRQTDIEAATVQSDNHGNSELVGQTSGLNNANALAMGAQAEQLQYTAKVGYEAGLAEANAQTQGIEAQLTGSASGLMPPTTPVAAPVMESVVVPATEPAMMPAPVPVVTPVAEPMPVPVPVVTPATEPMPVPVTDSTNVVDASSGLTAAEIGYIANMNVANAQAVGNELAALNSVVLVGYESELAAATNQAIATEVVNTMTQPATEQVQMMPAPVPETAPAPAPMEPAPVEQTEQLLQEDGNNSFVLETATNTFTGVSGEVTVEELLGPADMMPAEGVRPPQSVALSSPANQVGQTFEGLGNVTIRDAVDATKSDQAAATFSSPQDAGDEVIVELDMNPLV